MRRLFYLQAAFLSLCAVGTVNAQGPEGVDIDGVVWATANVAEAGSFAAGPTDPGQLFTLMEARVACPAGWRTPSAAEFRALIKFSDSRWDKVDGVVGRRFGEGAHSMFLPAAGHFNASKGDVGQSMNGYYWSSTLSGLVNGYNLLFGGGEDCGCGDGGRSNVNINANAALVVSNMENNRMSVRCVKEMN